MQIFNNFMQIFMRFYKGLLKQLQCRLLLSYILFLTHLNGNLDLLDCIKFPKLDGQNAFFSNLAGPWS